MQGSYFYNFVLIISDSSLAFSLKGGILFHFTEWKNNYLISKKSFQRSMLKTKCLFCSKEGSFRGQNRSYCIFTFTTCAQHWFFLIYQYPPPNIPHGRVQKRGQLRCNPSVPPQNQSPGKQWASPALTAVGFGTDFDLAKLLSWGSPGEELKTQDYQRRKVSGTQTGLTPAQEKQCQGLEKNSFFLSFPGSGHQASCHGTGGRPLP